MEESKQSSTVTTMRDTSTKQTKSDPSTLGPQPRMTPTPMTRATSEEMIWLRVFTTSSGGDSSTCDARMQPSATPIDVTRHLPSTQLRPTMKDASGTTTARRTNDASSKTLIQPRASQTSSRLPSPIQLGLLFSSLHRPSRGTGVIQPP